ncbi:ATP-dependent RNA helicase [Operophtera brumata]|uniref:ATP-dependent RNA helicase n=1 Tax=Operophtera brumata TaxID=104452 RepID=A0A0L7LFU6_OPEBR|nr:ATP-dependent RNA helicase [Operophtera brumata]
MAERNSGADLSSDSEHYYQNRIEMGRSPSPRRSHYKRKRSVSRERERHKQRRTSPAPSTNKSIDIEFSFESYKRDLNKIILYSSESNTVVNNLDDFWIFLKKYEATMRKASKPILADDTTTTNFSKFNCINFTTTMKYVDTVNDDRGGRRLDPKLFEAFLNIVSIYIDFKNKEKFEKLRKLRQAQRDLPVAKFRTEIVSAVQNERVVVVAGDTGCGKSTQVPQYLHEAGLHPTKADCVCFAIKTCRIRNTDSMSSENLPDYDVIILDEIHERHLMGDFLLGVLKCLIHSRTDIKLVLMSATINIKLFEDYFAAESATVVPGRLYPIELNYKPVFVFDYPPEGVRKCIVSTNIAETSVKEMSYDSTTKMQRLKEFWISKASADQRKGRAGRTGPGVCYRIYPEKQFNEMESFSTPEVSRVPLASLLLLMSSLGVTDGALTFNEKLTSLGRALANLPVEVSLAKALVIGAATLPPHKRDSALALAAALGIRSIYTTRAHRDFECENSRKPDESDHGDPLTLLSLYCAWLTVKAENRGGRAWCTRRGIEEQRLYELTKLAAQLRGLLQMNNLMETIEPEAMSSAERAMRHGQLKQLKDMRRR